MKIGIVASSGGAVVKAVREIVAAAGQTLELTVVTDRVCGIEEYCAAENLPCRRIENPDNAGFSQTAKEHFDEAGVDFVVIFFLRLVTCELFAHYPTFNLHPSLLPAFKGFGPIKKALKTGVRFMGATLHGVDDSVDGGPILAQVCAPVSPGHASEDYWNGASFVQKVYLMLVLVDAAQRGALDCDPAKGEYRLKGSSGATDRCNPALEQSDYLKALQGLQEAKGLQVI